VPTESRIDVECDDPAEVGRVEVTERKTRELAAGVGENAFGARNLEEAADFPLRVRDARLEADAIEPPELWEIFQARSPEERRGFRGGGVGARHRMGPP